MRYRGRHNNDTNKYNDNNGKITLTEFKFYNTKKKVISTKVLNDIENQFKETKKYISNFTKTENASLLDLKDVNSIHSENDLETIYKKTGKKIEREIYWTNINFAKYGIGFQFTYHPKNIYIDILEFTSTKANCYNNDNKKEYKIKFTAKEFCNLKTIFKQKVFLNFKLTKLQKDFLTNMFYESSEKIFIYFQIFNSWNEVLDYIIKYSYIKNYRQTYTDSNTFETYLKELFDIKLENENKYQFIGTSSYREKTYHIIKVIEKRIENINYRIAICINLEYKDELNYEFKVFKETDREYNYIDENRIFFFSNRYFFLDSSLNSYDQGKLIINHKLIEKMEENIGEILNETEIVITPMIYNFYKNRVSSFDEKDFLSYREKLIIEQYIKLLKNGRKIKFGDTIITKNEIKISDQHFKIRFNENFIDLIDRFSSVKKALNIKDANYNFNVVYENLLQISIINKFKTKTYTNFKDVEFQVNNINIKVERINNRMRINGKICRISDVYYILTKAICYTNQEEFDLYIKDVAYIGIEWKKMICDGIQINLNNPFEGIFKKTNQPSIGNMYMRFSLLWDTEKRTHVHLLLNNKKYLIKYKGKFKKIFNYPGRTISLETLKNELTDCLENIKENDIYEIVENAIKEAEIVQERGEELVANTIKDINAEEIELEIRGNKIYGYKFKGRISNADYFIEKASLQVYKKIEGQWNQRCVVDDHTKQRIYEDRLANRLVNIFNEPKKIYTIV